jgi:hypothetical protein
MENINGELYTQMHLKTGNKCLLKFSAFLNLANIRPHITNFKKIKPLDLVVKIIKQCSIGININPMLTCLFLRPNPMFVFFWNLVCDLILVKLRNVENFIGHFIILFASIEIALGVKFTLKAI